MVLTAKISPRPDYAADGAAACACLLRIEDVYAPIQFSVGRYDGTDRIFAGCQAAPVSALAGPSPDEAADALAESGNGTVVYPAG